MVEAEDADADNRVMPNGQVTWFSDKKGFGFIRQEDGEKIFVHFTEISDEDVDCLVAGDLVEYEIEKDTFGTHAANVRIVSSE